MNSNNQLYTPNATTTRFGAVRPDNATIKFQPTSNLLFVPTATVAANGVVRPDGVSITVNAAGVLSIPVATGGPYTIVSASAVACVGFTNIVGQWSDASNYFDVFPPSGSSMSKLAGFMASLSQVYFAGDVNSDDQLRTQWVVQSDRIRVWVQNSEQRAIPTGNYIAIWNK
jgi:hypothetical protein